MQGKLLAKAIADALEGSWRAKARPSQIEPDGDWSIWLLMAGRGFGKSRSGAEWILEEVAAGRRRISLVGATAADVRDVMVEGESGILACSPDWNRPTYEPSKRRLTWPNGAIATTFSADEPQRLRGPQSDCAWCDEIAAWRFPDAFDMLLFGLRLGKQPRCVITTTPRPVRIIRDLLKRDDVVVTRGNSYENRDNLAPEFFSHITRKYEGTRLGRQELEAELLDDVPGALWTLGRIDELRRDICPPLRRCIVAIDPSGSGDDEADEAGIIVAGVGEDDHAYVIADLSGRYTPTEWARIAITAYHAHQCDRVIAEQNYGGDMVRATLMAIDPNIPYTAVHASRGKVQRAEPVSALYERGIVHHCGVFSELEDELTSFSTAGYLGNGSPGRADACIWALTELLGTPIPSFGIFEATRREALGDPIRPTGRPLIDVYNEARARIEAGLSPFGQPDNRVGWRKAYDAIASAATPNHPDVPAQTFEAINGPNVRSTWAIGSVEWMQEQEKLKNAG